jgi:NADPH-dependent glutamate synthase beta subunit-like oxidoreductase
MSLKFAIVGSGPAGFFTAKSLLRHLPSCKIDMFERFPVPYGLIRYGVAPDHSDIKNIIQDFSALAHSPSFRFFGNVCLVL